MTPAELRALFPATATLAYLNAAASSPLATTVAEAAQRHLLETMEHGDVGFPRWLQAKEVLRERLARFVGAPTSQLGFTPSTSMGMGAVAELLWRKGVREVLTLEGEFPSTTVPLLARGHALRFVSPRADGSFHLDDLEAALTPSTGAVAVSAVQFASGFRLDLPPVAALCQARGLPLAINAAQALGQVPLDVTALGADFLCATSHKWFMGGYGVGFFYVKRGWLEEYGLPWAGWLATPEVGRWDSCFGAQREPTSNGFVAHGVTLDRRPSALEGAITWSALESVAAALTLHEQVGITVTERHNRRLQQQLRAGLRSRGFAPNAPDDQVAGIAVIPVRGTALDAVRALLKQGVVTTPRGVGVRLSTHVFNTEQDVERALAAIDRVGLQPA